MTAQWKVQLVALTVLLALPGCAYVSGSALEDRKDNIDQDGDGVPYNAEVRANCDDQDPNRTPGAPEIPYDGIDNDCAGDGDLLDVDGDGVPGISREAYEALNPQEPWPEAFAALDSADFPVKVDCRDDPAVEPKAPQIYPVAVGDANANEIPYDGIDHDCARDNDFDVDGDGYLAPEAEIGGAYDAYVAAWGYEGDVAGWGPAGAAAPVAGDCNDQDPSINPGVLPEDDLFYDGVDQDCSGNNDFDRDGDGYMPQVVPSVLDANQNEVYANAGLDVELLYNAFVKELYGDEEPPFFVPDSVCARGEAGDCQLTLDAFSDCLDIEDEGLRWKDGTVVKPEEVFPGASGDVNYDGVDANCFRDNEFDADFDAFVKLGEEDAYADYIDYWGFTSEDLLYWASLNSDVELLKPGLGDCEDQEPSAYPAALELLGDGTDQDCDGDEDGTFFVFERDPDGVIRFEWESPGMPRIGRVGDLYVIATQAESYSDAVSHWIKSLIVMLPFSLDSARSAARPNPGSFIGAQLSNRDYSPFTDMIDDPNDDDSVYLAVSSRNTAGGLENYQYLSIYRVQPLGQSLKADFGLGPYIGTHDQTVGYTPNDVMVGLDGQGQAYAAACSDSLTHVSHQTDDVNVIPEFKDPSQELGGQVCYQPSVLPQAAESVDLVTCQDDPVVPDPNCLFSEFTNDDSMNLTGPTAVSPDDPWWYGDQHRDRQGEAVLVRIAPARSQVDARLIELDDDVILFPQVAGNEVISADVTLYDDTIYAVAVVEEMSTGNRQVAFGWGPPGNLDYSTLTYETQHLPNLMPEAASIYVDADRVVLAVSGEDTVLGEGAVGWLFLGTP